MHRYLKYSNRNTAVFLKTCCDFIVFKNGERKNLKNYRPLSLTNVDYKIFAHVLAKRLQNVADKIIKREQSAYNKGRYIGENVRFILGVFEYYLQNDLDGILLFLDFEKAFDSVEYNFMFKTLKKFNFGSNFIGMIKTLYNKTMFKLKNNEWISKPCTMERGIRQGCPVFALLFTFVLEILAIQIRNDNQSRRLSFQRNDTNDDNIKIVQHADDCTGLIKDTESLTKILKQFQNSQELPDLD